jgi:hypothetical protein
MVLIIPVLKIQLKLTKNVPNDANKIAAVRNDNNELQCFQAVINVHQRYDLCIVFKLVVGEGVILVHHFLKLSRDQCLEYLLDLVDIKKPQTFH